MKLAIVGSRTFNNYDLLVSSIKDNYDVSKITHIVSGGAKGADSLGERFALDHNIETLIFKPDWNKYGKSAGYIRNVDIVNACDTVIAFWDEESKGTKHTIDIAEGKGKSCIIVKYKQ